MPFLQSRIWVMLTRCAILLNIIEKMGVLSKIRTYFNYFLCYNKLIFTPNHLSKKTLGMTHLLYEIQNPNWEFKLFRSAIKNLSKLSESAIEMLSTSFWTETESLSTHHLLFVLLHYKTKFLNTYYHCKKSIR